MQPSEKSKQMNNELVKKYGPLGPRHLLAAALLMQPREEAESEERKAEKARLADLAAA